MNKKIFLILWGNPDFYQTLVFLSKYLDKEGYNVYLFRKAPDKYNDLSKNLSFGKSCKIIKFNTYLKKKNFFYNFLNLIFFSFFCLKKYLKIKPKNIIFFNYNALYCQFLFYFFKKKGDNFIYHNFDFNIPKNLKSYKEKLNSKIEFFLSGFSDFYIFPTFERAKIFNKYTNKSIKFFYEFKNCFPRNYKPIVSKKLFSKYRNFVSKKKKIICHLGSIGPSHNIKQIILSAKYINNNFLIIIGGISLGNYVEYLEEIIDKNNLNKKIVLLKNIDRDIWFEILSNSTLGLCFYENHNLSHRHMAGTSQKFNNYLLFKKPMLVNDNVDFKKFKKKHDIFNLVKSDDPMSIAKNITSLINDKRRYNKIKKNMMNSFNNELNFEFQFFNSYKKILTC